MNVIFSKDTILSDENGFIVFQNYHIVISQIFFRNVLRVFQLNCILFFGFFCFVLPSDKTDVILFVERVVHLEYSMIIHI